MKILAIVFALVGLLTVGPAFATEPTSADPATSGAPKKKLKKPKKAAQQASPTTTASDPDHSVDQHPEDDHHDAKSGDKKDKKE